MTPQFAAHSFDRPRERPTLPGFSALTLDGESLEHTFRTRTLVVAIKSSCDGCRDFVHSPLEELRDVTTVIVSREADHLGEWTNALQPVLVAPELLDALDVKWPPFYVLIDPQRHVVLTEGVVFAPAQVAQEIASYLV